VSAQNRFAEKPAASWSWLWQAVTGIGLIALAGLHMIAHHFVVPQGIRDFAGIVEYLSNPIIVALEVAFLVAVTAHAILGVRAILFDLGLSARAERIVTRILTGVGMLTVAYGIWLTWTITHLI
jgi:succinate dehydrogenase hydrophobic anchor subunit